MLFPGTGMELVNSWVEPGLDLCLMSTMTGGTKDLKCLEGNDYSIAWPSNSFGCILPKNNFEKLGILHAFFKVTSKFYILS